MPNSKIIFKKDQKLDCKQKDWQWQGGTRKPYFFLQSQHEIWTMWFSSFWDRTSLKTTFLWSGFFFCWSGYMVGWWGMHLLEMEWKWTRLTRNYTLLHCFTFEFSISLFLALLRPTRHKKTYCKHILLVRFAAIELLGVCILNVPKVKFKYQRSLRFGFEYVPS